MYLLISSNGIGINCSFLVLPVPLSASELSLTEVRDKVPPLRRLDPGLMPLPDTACGLEWSSLVNAAKAYEGMRSQATVYSQTKMLKTVKGNFCHTRKQIIGKKS